MKRQTIQEHRLVGQSIGTATSVLLVDPEPDLLDTRCRLISCSHISVHAIGNYAQIYQLLELDGYNLIVLSLRPNEIQACHVAEYARRRWPKAKLLLLGESCGCLDDPLYDEIVNPCGNSAGFIEAAERLLESTRTGRIIPTVPWY
jgi:DNA-binding NtrC family response regulator